MKIMLFDAAKLKGELVLRTRRAGERFAPRGMGGKRKSLHEFMIDEKIPRHLREFVPILADKEKVWVLEMNKKIVWVVGMRIDDRFRIGDGTKQVLKIEWKPR